MRRCSQQPEPPGPPRAPNPAPDPAGNDDPEGDGPDDDTPTEKIVIKLSDGKARSIKYLATTTYWGPDGKPISAAEFLQRLFGELSSIVADEDRLRAVWSDPDNRETFLDQLADRGFDLDRLNSVRGLVDAPDSDLFDVLAYVLFTSDPLTRHERVEGVREKGLGQENAELESLLLSILHAYETRGESELGTRKLGQFVVARHGSIGESRAKLGDMASIKKAFRDRGNGARNGHDDVKHRPESRPQAKPY